MWTVEYECLTLQIGTTVSSQGYFDMEIRIPILISIRIVMVARFGYKSPKSSSSTMPLPLCSSEKKKSCPCEVGPNVLGVEGLSALGVVDLSNRTERNVLT